MKPLIVLNCVAFLLIVGNLSVGAESTGDASAKPWDEVRVDGAEVFRGEHSLTIRFAQWPSGGKVTIPRLNNSVLKAFIVGDPSDAALELSPGVNTWDFKLPQTLPEGAETAVVVVTESQPRLPAADDAIEQRADGSFTLHARHAVVHGRLLRFEPQPHKNTVGYWADANDWVHWPLQVRTAGRFDVQIFQGCGTGQGGSNVQINIGDSATSFNVEDTGHFQNFKWRDVGTIEIDKPGRVDLEVRCMDLAKGAVMDVRSIRLVPVK